MSDWAEPIEWEDWDQFETEYDESDPYSDEAREVSYVASAWGVEDEDPYLDSVSGDDETGCDGTGCVGCDECSGEGEVGAERAIMVSQIEPLDRAIQALQTEVVNSSLDVSRPEVAKFRVEWSLLHVDWGVWYARAKEGEFKPPAPLPSALIPLSVAGVHAAEYDEFERRYNEMLRRFQSLGGKPTAPPISHIAPLEKALVNLGGGATDLAKWALPVGLAFGALYLLGPGALSGLFKGGK